MINWSTLKSFCFRTFQNDNPRIKRTIYSSSSREGKARKGTWLYCFIFQTLQRLLTGSVWRQPYFCKYLVDLHRGTAANMSTVLQSLTSDLESWISNSLILSFNGCRCLLSGSAGLFCGEITAVTSLLELLSLSGLGWRNLSCWVLSFKNLPLPTFILLKDKLSDFLTGGIKIVCLL